jgi:hypothetical protein
MEEQELRERLETTEVPAVRLTVEDLVGSGRRRVRRRRTLQAAGAVALATGVLLAMPPVLARHGGGWAPSAAMSTVRCPVRVLPLPPGADSVSADAVDPSGRYILGNEDAGSAGPGNGFAKMRPVLWTDGHPQVLPLITKTAQATAVNASGVVVALAAVNGTQEWDAILRYTDARPTRLIPPPGEWLFNGIVKINTAGDTLVSANSRTEPGRRAAVFLWPAGSTTGIKLPLPAGAAGFDLTDDGTIIGDIMSDDLQKFTAYAWDRKGNGRKLAVPAGQYSEAFAARGEWATGNLRPSGVARWNLRTGALTVLDDVQGIPNAINVDGWIVAGAAVYRDDAPVKLAPVGKATGYPIAIADNGTVVGSLQEAPGRSQTPLAWSCH